MFNSNHTVCHILQILIKYFAFFHFMFCCSERYIHYVSADKYIELKEMGKGRNLRNHVFLFVRGDFDLFLEKKGID